MTKKTASKKKATKEQEIQENTAKTTDQQPPEVKNDQKPEAEATDKAEANPKAKRKGRPARKKSPAKSKTAEKPGAEQEQKSDTSGSGKRNKKKAPKTPQAEKVEDREQKPVPEPKSAPERNEQQEAPAAEAKAVPEAAEREVNQPKPKAKKGTKKSKARGAKNAAKAPEKSDSNDKGAEELKPVTKQGNRVVVASRNPAKIKAAELGFNRMFPDQEFIFDGLAVPSGVADQPMTDDETFMGALHRALMAQQEQPEADYWIGLEGGLQEEGDDFYAFAWIMVIGPKGMQGKSRTGTFVLPLEVAELVRDGKELGEADDIIFGQTNSKHSSGAIGILTHGLLDRAEYYAGAVAMALIPFKNPQLYAVEDTLIEAEV